MIPGITASARMKGGSGGGNRVQITVNAQVENMPGYPLYIALQDLPARFWDGISNKVDGHDVRVKNGAGLDLPFDLVAFNPVSKTGFLFARVDLAAGVQTTLYVHWGNPSDKRVLKTAPNGRNATWAGFDRVYMFGGDYEDHTGVGSDLIVGDKPRSMERSGYVTTPFSASKIIPDGKDIITVSSSVIARYDATTFVKSAENPSPGTGIAGYTGTTGACIVGNSLYVILTNTVGIPNAVMAVYDKTSLARTGYFPLAFDSGVTVPSSLDGGLTYDPYDGFVYAVFTTGEFSYIWKFDLSLLKFVSTIPVTGTITVAAFATAIGCWNGGFLVALRREIYRVTKTGAIKGTVFVAPESADLTGIERHGDGVLAATTNTIGMLTSGNIQSVSNVGYRYTTSGWWGAEGVPKNTAWTMACSAIAVVDPGYSAAMVSYTKKNSADNASREVIARRSSGELGLWNQVDGWTSGAGAMALPTKYRCHATHNGTASRSVFLDGVKKATTSSVSQRPPASLVDVALYVGVGEGGNTTEIFKGTIGFVYLRPGVLSDAWIAAESLNLTNTAAFYSVGP